LESLAHAKKLTDGAELGARREAWEHAFLTTPHGRPVEL
jgi:hypothetical protein